MAVDEIERLRDETEAELSSILRSLNSRQRRRVVQAVEQYGSVSAIPAEFWLDLENDGSDDIAALMLLLLMGTYRTQARELGVTDIEPSLLRTRSAPAAGRLAVDIVADRVNSIQRRLRAKIDSRLRDLNRLPPDEAARLVRRSIDDALSDADAERAAVTHTTRGVSIGQTSAGSDVSQGTGLAIDSLWRTERDDRVCPICRPLDGKRSAEWEQILYGGAIVPSATIQDILLNGPPAHVNCRCRLELFFSTPQANGQG